MSFAVYPQADACRAWMPTTPLPPSISPPSPPMVCHMPKGHDGQHSNERHPTTLSRRWEGDARPPKPDEVAAVRDLLPTDNQRRAHKVIDWGDDPRPAMVGGEWRANLADRIAAALDEAEERGRRSVGLGDVLPNPCGDEYSSYPWYIAEQYGDYVTCSRSRGHDGQHEHSDSGMTWSTR